MTNRIAIDIVSDAVCPWCFIGKRRLEAALARLPADVDVAIGWRPFQLNPDMPAEGMDRKTYLATKFGGDERAKDIYARVSDAASSSGLALDFRKIGRTPNTVNAHRLIGFAGRTGKQDAVVEALFQAYFQEGRDIGDLATLTDVATACGLNAETVRRYLDSDEDTERVRAEDAMARRMGIQGVPCFIFNRKYAVSGAQEPEVFLQVFEALQKEALEAPAAPAE